MSPIVAFVSGGPVASSTPTTSSASSSFVTRGAPPLHTSRTPCRATPPRMQFDFGKIAGDALQKAKDAASQATSAASDAVAKSAASAKSKVAPAATKPAPATVKVEAEERPVESFMKPQPGEPGYVEPEMSDEPLFETDGPPAGPPSKARGLQLLKSDLLKSAPEKAGIGRQDVTFVYAPQSGEPGYVEPASERVFVSKLGISPFADDSNSVTKVGGLDAVSKAAEDVEAKESAPKIKPELLVEAVQDTYDIPDYLKPLPEDTPRRGYTWKNW